MSIDDEDDGETGGSRSSPGADIENDDKDEVSNISLPQTHKGSDLATLKGDVVVRAAKSEKDDDEPGPPRRVRQSGAAGLQAIGSSIQNLTDVMDTSSSPKRHMKAIRLLDADSYEDDVYVKAVQLFTANTAIADSFVAMRNKRTHRLYLDVELTAFESTSKKQKID